MDLHAKCFFYERNPSPRNPAYYSQQLAAMLTYTSVYTRGGDKALEQCNVDKLAVNIGAEEALHKRSC